MAAPRLPLAALGLALLALAQVTNAVRNLLGGEAAEAVLYLVWGCGFAFAAWGLGRPGDEDRVPTAVLGLGMAAAAGVVRLTLATATVGVGPWLWPLTLLATTTTMATVAAARLQHPAGDAWWRALAVRVAVGATSLGYAVLALRLATSGAYPVLPFVTIGLGIGGALTFAWAFRPAPRPPRRGGRGRAAVAAWWGKRWGRRG